MRAQCIICQELFENEDEVIAAISCGHTFHSHCLNQWLENSRTCPSCRVNVDKRKIIQRLYFDCAESNDEIVDDGKLKNEIDRLKLEVRKRDKEKNDIAKEKEKQADKIAELEKSKDSLTKSVKAEQTKCSSLMKTLKYYESQQKCTEQERDEYKRIKQKLVTLQSLDVLMNGAESEAAEIISTVGEGSGAVQSLSRQVAFLKREFEKQKQEKRQIKDHYEKIQLHDMSKNKKITDLSKENKQLRDQLERSEGDLKIAEREIEFIKRKNTQLKHKLQAAIRSPGNSENRSTSFTNILNDSAKMNAFASSTPKLGEPNSAQEVDLDLTPDLFASPVKTNLFPSQSMDSAHSSATYTLPSIKSSTSKSQKRPLDSDDAENQTQTKCLKITSAAEKRMQILKKDSTLKDVNSVTALASMNIFRKKDPGERMAKHSSIIKKGFDGLGGHTTFVNSKGGGSTFKKPIKLKKPMSQKSTSVPSLPKLDQFVILD